MIVGGVEGCIDVVLLVVFVKVRVLSVMGRVKSFDVARDGFVMGEGVGVLVFEIFEYVCV